MGSGQSTRKLTIDNEEVGVIGISESVVDRLTHKANETNGGVVNEVRSASETELSSQTAVPPPLPQSGDIPVNSGYPTYHPQLTLTALQIQQQKLEELRNQDNYWQNRVKNLERKHAHINDIIDTEYKKAVDQLYTDGTYRDIFIEF